MRQSNFATHFFWRRSTLVRFLAPLVLVAVTAGVVHAQKMTEKEKCLQEIQDARINLTKTEDTGRPGEKIEKEAMELFPIARRLCEQGNFDDAAKLVAYLRHLLAD